MDYQIIPNLTYFGRPVYTRNPSAANAAGEDEASENMWTGLHGIYGNGGKKRTRKYLSKNKRKSRKSRRV